MALKRKNKNKKRKINPPIKLQQMKAFLKFICLLTIAIDLLEMEIDNVKLSKVNATTLTSPTS